MFAVLQEPRALEPVLQRDFQERRRGDTEQVVDMDMRRQPRLAGRDQQARAVLQHRQPLERAGIEMDRGPRRGGEFGDLALPQAGRVALEEGVRDHETQVCVGLARGQEYQAAQDVHVLQQVEDEHRVAAVPSGIGHLGLPGLSTGLSTGRSAGLSTEARQGADSSDTITRRSGHRCRTSAAVRAMSVS